MGNVSLPLRLCRAGRWLHSWWRIGSRRVLDELLGNAIYLSSPIVIAGLHYLLPPQHGLERCVQAAEYERPRVFVLGGIVVNVFRRSREVAVDDEDTFALTILIKHLNIHDASIRILGMPNIKSRNLVVHFELTLPRDVFE
jgi:hypothetical protein